MYDNFAQKLEAFLLRSVDSDTQFIKTVNSYLIDNGGKRIRPRLCYLLAQSLGYRQDDTLVLVSAIIELIHTATLMHDDVVDAATVRRGVATVHTKWNVPSAVLVGDFIYSRSFQLAMQLDNMQLARVLADTSNQLAEGEVAQLVQKSRSFCDEETYLRIIYKKTGVLFSAAFECAAILAGCSDKVVAQCAQAGKQCGLGFQIVDDLHDYQNRVTGKHAGIDFSEGKATLPLIHLLQQVDTGTREQITTSLGTTNRQAYTRTCQLIRQYGSDAYCRDRATTLINSAVGILQQVCQPSQLYDELVDTVKSAAQRDS